MTGARLGILGGTFDPIHFGHLGAAEAARQALHLDEILILPSASPPHRAAQPQASGYHRFAMIALAIADRPRLVASDFELQAMGPSYTAASLHGLHDLGYQASQLFFLAGADAFAEIATWKNYPAILDQAHFVVIARPGYSLEELRQRLPALAVRMEAAHELAGEQIPPKIFLVNAATPDISSTTIRTRLAQDRDIADLVPALVDDYIRRERLYRGAPVSHKSGHPLA
jgi:nicotinate-nucleotide adenylyltransferase